MRKHDRQMVVRLPAELYGELQAFTAAERERIGYSRVSLADVVRKILRNAVPPRSRGVRAAHRR